MNKSINGVIKNCKLAGLLLGLLASSGACHQVVKGADIRLLWRENLSHATCIIDMRCLSQSWECIPILVFCIFQQLTHYRVFHLKSVHFDYWNKFKKKNFFLKKFRIPPHMNLLARPNSYGGYMKFFFEKNFFS